MTPRNLANYRSRLMLDRARMSTLVYDMTNITTELRRERQLRADEIAERIASATKLVNDAHDLIDFTIERMPRVADEPARE